MLIYNINMNEQEQISFPYVYGSMAFSMGKKTDTSNTHKWIAYVRGANNEDLSYLLDRVEFVLHSSFENPVRCIAKPPFEIQEHGWGEFEILIRLCFKHPDMPCIEIPHMLKLHHHNSTASQAVKKPLCSEVYDEIVFTEMDEHIQEMLQNKRKMENISMIPQLEQGEQVDTIIQDQPLKSIQCYSRHFLPLNADDHRVRLEDAHRFINGEIKSIEEKMRNAEVDVMKVYDELYDRLP